MNEGTTSIPRDDPDRQLAIADPEGAGVPHVGIAGGTYTILVSGKDTAGKYCLIDMHVPAGGGPPPHRHDFEESFTVLAGEIEVTFRGETQVLRQGQTANIPANAPHRFRNTGEDPARLLCICAPAGQEEFFQLVGTPVDGRTEAAPKPGPEEQAALVAKIRELAPRFVTEMG